MSNFIPLGRVLTRCSAVAGASLWAVAIAAAAPPGPAAQSAPVAAPPPASPSSAQLDAGEPRADTSSAAGNGVEPASPGSAGATATGGSSNTGNARPRPSASAVKPDGHKAPAATDRLDLGTATVTGDREQPKVMYIVPWSSSDIGNLSGKPMNSLVDEALAPVDRDEFKREVRYFGALKAGRPQPAAAKTTADAGDK